MMCRRVPRATATQRSQLRVMWDEGQSPQPWDEMAQTALSSFSILADLGKVSHVGS